MTPPSTEIPCERPVRHVALVGAEGDATAVLGVLSRAVSSVTVHGAADGISDASHVDAPDATVLDARMRRRDVTRAATELVERWPDAALIALCDRPRSAAISTLLNAGARGIVIRDQMDRTLIPTLLAAAAGQVCVPATGSLAAARPVLSIRERQVVGLVALGLTNSEIGERLFLAESTVKSHLSSAFSKLGVTSRHEAVERLVTSSFPRGLPMATFDPEPAPSPAFSGAAR